MRTTAYGKMQFKEIAHCLRCDRALVCMLFREPLGEMQGGFQIRLHRPGLIASRL